MKRLKVTVFLSFIMVFLLNSVPGAAAIPEEVQKTKSTIQTEMIMSHIEFLASWHCRGRETGQKGMDVAAKYIETVFKGAGVKPAVDFGGYYQDVELETLTLTKDIKLELETIQGSGKAVINGKLKRDFLPIRISGEMAVTAPVVFAGYGITAPEHNYDDYKNLNVEGKIVLVMRHEPGEKDPKSPFDGNKNSIHGTILTKILNAQKHGAVGILFVTDPMNHKDQKITSSYSSGAYWSELNKEDYKDSEQFKFMRFSPLMRMVGDDYGIRIPAILISGNMADHILGHKKSLKDIQQRIDSQLKAQSFAIAGKTVNMAVSFERKPVEAYNIVAKVEGSDPKLKNEVVIVGGHYDHVGVDKRGRLYGGADDNASGTAVVMELARAFQKLKQKPKRTILFVLFTAEEKGLYGARYYVKNPIFPLDKTVAMINLDMLGRNDPKQMSLVGKYQYPKLYDIIDDLNKKHTKFDFNFSIENFIRNSDHFPFMRKDIPSVFFNSGSHEELHMPTDRTNLIEEEKIGKVAKLVFLTLWEVAEQPEGADLRSIRRKEK
jgi:hypothetical protein